MTSDTWANRDLLVLRAIVDLFEEEEDEGGIQPWEIQQRTRFDEDTVRKALRALNRQPSYFEDAQVIDNGDIWMVGAPTQKALCVAGQWPSPEVLLNRLIAELQRSSEDEDVPDEERSKLKRTAAFLGTSAWQLAVSALGGAGGNIISGT